MTKQCIGKSHNYKVLSEYDSIGGEVLISKNIVGNLDLAGSKVTVLPEGLEVGGFLYLGGSKVSVLPKGLKVGDGLYLRGSNVTVVPEGLIVGGELDLQYSKVTTLPEGFKVGGTVLLDTDNMSIARQISGRYRVFGLCRYNLTIDKNKLKIGCKTKTLLQWTRWFEGVEEFDTPRGTEEFEQIERAFNTIKNLLEENR